MLSKNLIKANQFVLREKDPVVLDSNELFSKKVELYQKDEFSEGFSQGLGAPEVDAVYLGENEEEFSQGIEAVPLQSVYEGPSPEEMIAKAQEEIEQLHAEADKAISFLKKRSMEEGREEGYQSGRIEAMRELEEEKIKWKEKEALLEQEFQKRVDALEVQFVETITGIYEEIFKVELSSYKPVLFNAISNTIRSIEGVKDFIIHVSKEDYREVIAAKAELLDNMISKTVTVEIVEDIMLKENECVIETDNGIFDCSIGAQVEELKRRLRLLSYEN